MHPNRNNNGTSHYKEAFSIASNRLRVDNGNKINPYAYVWMKNV